MRPALFSANLLILAAGLAGCNSTQDISVADHSKAALPTMERVARGANQCWFKSGDKEFAPYRMALELNSFSGRPRILLVRKNSPETRPLLVVQAEGNPARLDAFGPMMGQSHASRIRSDVTRWANGDSVC